MADNTTKSSRPQRHGEVITCIVLGILVAAIVLSRGVDNDPLLMVGTAAGFIGLFLVQHRLELRNHRNAHPPRGTSSHDNTDVAPRGGSAAPVNSAAGR